MTYRTLLAFMNKIIGKEYTHLYRFRNFQPETGFVHLDAMPEMAFENLALGGPYGADIPWKENPFELEDIPVIEHGITREQLPENTPLQPEEEVAPLQYGRFRLLVERIISACRCGRRKVQLLN